MGAITGFFDKMNYVHKIELIVIISIALFLVFVFHALGLLKPQK
jgi:hypothetical protein